MLTNTYCLNFKIQQKPFSCLSKGRGGKELKGSRGDAEEIDRPIIKFLLIPTNQTDVGLVRVTEGDEGTRPSLDIRHQIKGERYAGKGLDI